MNENDDMAAQLAEAGRLIDAVWHNLRVAADIGLSTDPPHPAYRTERGFAMWTDIPTTDGNFTVQESSAVMTNEGYGPWVWVGLGSERAHLNVEQATTVRDALNGFIRTAEQDQARYPRTDTEDER